MEAVLKNAHAALLNLGAFAALVTAAPGLARCELGRTAELPVTMAGRKPLVAARIDGRTLPFLADSGALLSMVTPALASALGLRTTDAPEKLQMHGVGGSFATRLAVVPSFELGGQRFTDAQFLVGGDDPDAAGLIGQDLLARSDTEYDLAGGAIRFFRPAQCSAEELAYWTKQHSSVELEPVRGRAYHIIATVLLNGQPLRAAFDTGAARSVISLEAAARAGFRPGGPGVTSGGTGIGLGQRPVAAWVLPVASLRIGDEEIRSRGLRIADIGSIGVDMLIGADFFLSHRLLVSNSRQRLYVSYSGGPIFDVPPETVLVRGAPWKRGTPLAELADADAYRARGMGAMARRDLDGALWDLDRAVALRPEDHRLYFVRAQVRMLRNEALLARVDLDATLRLKPDHAEALVARAGLSLLNLDAAGARQDLAAASPIVAPQSNLRLAIAATYTALEDWAQAIAELDRWIATHPDDRRRAEAFNGRCWSRAMLDRDLPAALADCNEAIALAPQAVAMLDSRAMVRLRMGDLSGAIADYDRVLTAQPGIAWSWFGRGLAKLRSGGGEDGKADIVTAIRIDPALPEKARKIGLIGSTADPR